MFGFGKGAAKMAGGTVTPKAGSGGGLVGSLAKAATGKGAVTPGSPLRSKNPGSKHRFTGGRSLRSR